MTSKRNILANFERLFKPTPGHSFTLLVVKDKFSKTYNFYLEDVAWRYLQPRAGFRRL
ncbi:hypothetical protein QY885_06155 [Latilactobacillus sakei]